MEVNNYFSIIITDADSESWNFEIARDDGSRMTEVSFAELKDFQFTLNLAIKECEEQNKF